MKKIKTDVTVVGGGPAGLAAALKAAEGKKVVLIDRGKELGGILNQCIHDGFGNFIFNKTLTGPEYAQHYIKKVEKSSIEILKDTIVLDINLKKELIATNSKDGIIEIKSKSIVLAMGCRERTRSQILIPGTRPAGIYTAGTAQRLINIDGIMPGKNIVILGSGDIGLIMARRLKFEGANVLGVYEIMTNPGGLTRNIVQCLNDYNIPLYLNHTITNIFGNKRIEGVTIAEVNEKLKPIKNTEKNLSCDCLILSVGLIPEIELVDTIDIKIDSKTKGIEVDNKMETSIPGIFACGNIVNVFDLVDDVTKSSEIAGKFAAEYIEKELKDKYEIKIKNGKNVKHIVPKKIKNLDMENITIYFRVNKEMKDVEINLDNDGTTIFRKKERIVKPAEMQKIELKNEILKNFKNEELKLNIRSKYD